MLQIVRGIHAYTLLVVPRLDFDLLARISIVLMGPCPTFLNTRLGIHSGLEEASPVVLLSLVPLVPHLLLGFVAIGLLVVHFLTEFLLPLEIPNALIGLLLLLFKLYDPVLDLGLLVLLYLREDDGVHHDIVRSCSMH